MKDIKRLLVFDFDETLFRMPGYTDRKSVERLYPELSFPDPYSFYDHPLSMSQEIHNIQSISPVHDDFWEAKKNPSMMVILITHRIESLRGETQKILDSYGLEFDESYFLGRATEKIDTLKTVMEKLPSLEEVSVYEDSLEQLSRYQDFFDDGILNIDGKEVEIGGHIGLDMQFVDKSKVITLFSFNKGRSRRIKLS